MKVFSVYGISDSGKTTTIENLIKGLKNRGYSVGSVKEIHSEAFAIDTEGSNTYRHKQAGAELVTARGMYETDVLFPKKLPIDDILELYTQDYVVLEGVTDSEVPKILCAPDIQQIEEKLDDTVFAISGVISNEISESRGLPVINAITKAEKLVDLVEQRVFKKLPNLNCGLFGRTCQQMAVDILKGVSSRDDCKVTKGSVEVLINGKKLEMVPFVRDIVESTVRGLLSSLRGYEPGSISINIRD